MARRLVLSVGEPGGIGPDLCLSLAEQPERNDLIVAADPALLSERARVLGLSVRILEVAADDRQPCPQGSLRVWPVASARNRTPQDLDPANADFVLTVIRESVKACLAGVFEGLVTGPVSKATLNQAGQAFTGHTEFIAEISGGHPVMMLTTPRLRVALATTHLPLKDVPKALDQPGLDRTLRVLEGDLRHRFGISRPRILVAGLNPHAGESGHLGEEELTIIRPVVERLKAEGLSLEGPLPADTLFLPERLETADAVLAMYHDQGLPVLKFQGFGAAVNVTLGLPLIRTSVDHGVARELAGTGRAETGSLLQAIRLAVELASMDALADQS